MVDLAKNFDGTLEGAISATSKLNGTWAPLQKFITFGDFGSGISKKIDGTNFEKDSNGTNIQNYVSQIANLDKTQQDAIISATKFDKKNNDVRKTIKDLSNEVANFTRINSRTFESALKNWDGEKILSNDVSNLMAAGGMKNGDNYALPETDKAVDAIETYINTVAKADEQNRLYNAGITEMNGTTYVLTQKFKQLAGIEEAEGVVKTVLTAKQKALNIAMALGKQLMASLIAFGISLVATKIIEWVSNLKTRSEELIDTMNSSHDAAEQATKDVEEIQSKIDDLNKSLKDAGVDKIEDIVDPAERERLQAINDMLEAQLELKKQISKDADDKANTDTSAVVNDKSENSIVKSSTQPQVSYDSNGNPITIFSPTPDKVTKTESLQEYTAALEDTTQKRRDLQVELDQIEASSGKDSKAYANKKKELDALNEAFESQKTKVEELSSAVSEQMGNYKTDADSFAQYKDEYVAGTNAMTAATKALADANDDVGISTTAYDILLQKMQATKNLMDRRNKDTSNNNPYTGAVKTLKASGLETGDDIRELSAVPANQTKAQAEAIKVLENAAKDAGVTLDQFVSALETVGLVAVRNSNNVKSLSDAMTALDNMQSAYQSCAQAVKEYNKTGYVTMDTLQSLCQLEPQYLNMLDLKNGKLKINTKTAQSLTQANIQLAKASILADTLNNIKDTNNLAKAEALLGDVTAVISDADTAIDAATEKSAQQAKDSDGWAGYDKVKRAGDIYKKNYHTLSGLLDDLGKQNPSKIWGKDDTSKSTKQATSAIDAWSTLTSAMKEYNEQGYITFQTLKSLTDLEDKYSSMLKKNDVTGQLEMRTDDFYDLMKAELKEAQTKGDGASEAQYNKILKWTNRNIKDQTMSYWDLVAAIEGYSAALEEAKGITDGFKGAYDNGKVVKEKTEKSRTGALDYEGTEAQSASLQSIKKYSQYDPDLINKAYNKDTGKIDLSGDVLKDAVVESLRQQAEAARTEGGAASEAIARSYEIAKENIENDVISVQDYFDGLGSTVEEFSSKIDEMQSAWTDLSDVTNEYNTYGGLSIDSIQKLLTMSPEYLQFLKLEGNQLVFNKEAMLAKTKADILAKAAELELKEETKDQAEILRALADSLDKGADSMEGMGKSADKLKTLMSQLNTVLNSFIGVFDDLNDKQSNDLKIQGEAWIDVIDKRIDALNEENDAQERAIELAKLQDEYERAKANKTVHVYGGKGQGFVWKADENAVREAGQNLSDKQREYKKQDEIDRLNKLKDKVQEANNLIGTSWDDYQKKLKYTAEFEAMTFEQMESHYDGFKGSVLNNMQAIQGATNVKNVINDISNLISTLETLANILNILNGGTGDGGGVFGFINQIKNMFTGENGDFDLGGGFKKMFDGAAKVVSDGWNWITGKNRAGSAALKSGTTATLDILGNTIKVNTGDIQRVSGGFFERLVGAAKDNLGSIGKFFSGA